MASTAEETLLAEIFGGKAREKRSPENCGHCLHDFDGEPLYAPGKQNVTVAVCCYCDATVNLAARGAAAR